MPDYYKYIQSAEWARRRTKVFAAAKGICQGCGRRAEHVHHRTYARLGQELDDDLVAVCHDCHRDIHLNHVEHADVSLWWATNDLLAQRRAEWGLPTLPLPQEPPGRRRRGGRNKAQERSVQTAVRPVNSPVREEIRKIPCPDKRCQAPAGEPCRTRNGNIRPANHLKRVNAHLEARGRLPVRVGRNAHGTAKH